MKYNLEVRGVDSLGYPHHLTYEGLAPEEASNLVAKLSADFMTASVFELTVKAVR